MLKLIVLVLFATTAVYCLPTDNSINNSDIIDNNNEKILSAKLEETTTNAQLSLFNNNDNLEEEKLYKQLNDDDLVESSNLTPESKQQPSGGLPNLKNLIDQTNTILMNIDNMIIDMEKNKKSTALIKIAQNNMKNLQTSLIRLNDNLNKLPVIGTPKPPTASGSAASSVTSNLSSNISDATYQTASNINSALNKTRLQLNKIARQFNHILQSLRGSLPGGGSAASSSNKPSTPKP